MQISRRTDEYGEKGGKKQPSYFGGQLDWKKEMRTGRYRKGQKPITKVMIFLQPYQFRETKCSVSSNLKPWCQLLGAYHPSVCTALFMSHLDQTPLPLCVSINLLWPFIPHSSEHPVTGTVCALRNWWAAPWPQEAQVLMGRNSWF